MTDKPPPPRRPTPDSDAEASLNEALSDLEQILGGKRSSREPVGVNEPSANDPLGQQYTIPLLDDVVVTPEERHEPGQSSRRPRHGPGSIEHDEDCQQLIRRLGNEIEVIVQTGVDEALRNANKDIMKRVREHINITLPEVLDEIAEIKARKES